MKKKKRVAKRTLIGVELETFGRIGKSLDSICEYLCTKSISHACRWSLDYAANNLRATDSIAPIAQPLQYLTMVQIEGTNRPEVYEHLETLRAMIAVLDKQATVTNRRVIEVAVLFTAERLGANHD